jgi:hypothetical protein
MPHGIDAKTLSQQREEARMGEMKRKQRPIKRALQIGLRDIGARG